MDKRIENKDRVSKETIQVYQQINIYDVIKETLLCKGVEICTGDRLVAKKYLEDSALYLYELKANSTNRLHVGLTIDRLCQRNGLCSEKGDKWVIVPRDIYCEVKEINDSYKKRCKEEEQP